MIFMMAQQISNKQMIIEIITSNTQSLKKPAQIFLRWCPGRSGLHIQVVLRLGLMYCQSILLRLSLYMSVFESIVIIIF